MKKLAIVEDHPDNRLLIEALLSDYFEVVIYSSGPEALAGLADATPDVVLLDISLPGMDGIEVLRHMKATPALARMPVIALTAHAMSGDRERLLAEGFDDYVSKPILDETELLAAIRRHLS